MTNNSPNNSPPVEIVPYDKRQDEVRELKRIITHLVEEKVTEATGGPEAIFQPFFQTKRMVTEIRRLQSVAEVTKFGYYFERWGCLAGCGATNETAAHHSLGMCHRCFCRITQRLKTIVREHTPETHENQGFVDTVAMARAALNPSIRKLAKESGHSHKPRFYTQEEAARAARIDPKTLYVWLRNGKVQPSIKVTDKRFFWTDADIEELKLLKRKNRSQNNSKAAQARWKKVRKQSGAGVKL